MDYTLWLRSDGMGDTLFTEHIKDWKGWGKVYQSIPAFMPLVRHIMHKEGLPFDGIENMEPGTNAVFKVGGYVIKIFAPPEFSMDGDFGINADVELFGMRLAYARGVPVPKLIADGLIEDRYSFRYIIMEYIDGIILGKIESKLSYDDKVKVGRQIRHITDLMSAPCAGFTPIDVIKHSTADKKWKGEGFPASFLGERLKYLADFHMNDNEKSFCHGDFHCDNILVGDGLKVHLIDLADAMHAPAPYDWAYIVSALFCFEKPYMTGYYGGDYDIGEVVDLCMAWLPVHAWGHATIKGHFKCVEDITSFAVLRGRLHELVRQAKGGIASSPTGSSQ